MNPKDKITRAMREAIDIAKGEADPRETVYHVRNRPGRVAVTNQTTGQTTIYPMPEKQD